MGRKFKKAAAALLVAAMFLQQCNVVSFAESDPTEMSADEQAAAEAQAQAEAEAAAQAAAEAQAQAEAEAAAQAAAEAEAAAQAAAEAQAQAEAEAAQAAAEAQAQAEAEAAAAQAAAEAQAQAEAEAAAQAAAEAEAAAQAEAEAQAAAEAETEQQARSARVNAGMEIRRDDLTMMLENVLPYLFVAETLVFPETQAEEAQEPAEEESLPVPEDWVMEGDPAYTELTDQVWNSLALADAQSTEEVTVINLYADEFGTLDTTQLYNIYEDQILDVTDNRYYVVNVIADSPDQVLDFSGFDLSENGFYLYYTESTQPCSVLYNFAAMDGEEYTYYKGTLRLWGDLQGTVLAPAATVEVEQNLAGAVYARNISVISPEAQLQRNIYIEGEPEVLEPETEAPVTEAPAPETEEPAPETEAAEPEIIEAPASETEAPAPETEAVTEEPETESESEAELETEIVTEAPETEPETEIVTEAPETETETEVITEEPETETETETEVVTETPETETETEEQEAINTLSADEPKLLDYEGDFTLEVTAEAVYNGEVLTAVEEQEYTIGLFVKEDDDFVLVGDEQTLTIPKDKSKNEKVVIFEGIASGEYYIYEVDKNEKPIKNGDFTIELKDGKMPFTIENRAAGIIQNESVELQLVYYDGFPSGFNCKKDISVELEILDRSKEKMSTYEKFYVTIFSDEKLKNVVETKTYSMEGKSEEENNFSLTLSSESETYYVAETDKEGNVIDLDNFAYTPTYKSTKGEKEENEHGVIEVRCGGNASEVITNKLNPTTINISIVNSSGKTLDGATFVILNSSEQRVTDICTVGDNDTFENTAKKTSELKDGETYYLYQIDAPDGYTPSSYKKFTVNAGLTNEVIIEDEKTEKTSSTIVITKFVYVGDYAVYATSSAAPYHFALFENSSCKKKVSNVKTFSVSGNSTGSKGTVTFENVEPGKTYYIAETDEYGIALSGSDPKVQYTPSNEVTVTRNTNHQVEVKNTWSYLPDGYNYIGNLTLTKEAKNSSDSAINVSNTFYIGLYKNDDFSGTPTVIPISLNGASSASVTNTFRLEEGSLTYYIQEVTQDDNKNWVPVSDISDYPYTSSVSPSSVTITKDSINSNVPSVTVTNTEKIVTEETGPTTDVELYLTKRVYEGSNHHETNDTFYVGLFKNPEMTELYADPIPMPMAGREEGDLTQKITMSVSESNETTIYVAEVHADGTPVTSSQYESFGYEIGSEQPIKVTFAPSQGQDQMRAVILNGVYGTMTAEDWQNIYDEIEDLYGDDDEIGLADDLEEDAEENGTSTVQTADNTPVAGTMALMAAALIVLGFSIRRRRRAS